MLETTLLSSIAKQLLSADVVEVEGKRLPVRRTSKQGLRTVTFTMERRQYAAIVQNPEKPSRWGQLARSGHQVVQFKDVQTNQFVAVAVDGEAKEYESWKSRCQRATSHLRANVAKEPKRQTVTFEELAYSNMLQVQALVELLSEKGLLTKEEVLERVKKLQGQSTKKVM